MPASQPLSLPLLLAALLTWSVAVAKNLPDSNQTRAHRPRHPHQGAAPRAGHRLGDPLPDLTRAPLQAFTPVTRFGRVAAGHFDPLTALGGSLLQSQTIDDGKAVPARDCSDKLTASQQRQLLEFLHGL